MEIKQNTKIQDILFIVLLLSVFLFLGYQNILFLRPQGIHFMRQTDSVSFVSNFYNEGFNFFSPKLFNLKNIDGKAACEFPIVYYLTALSYLIFGEKEFLLKLFHLIIISAGIFCLYKLTYLLLKDYIYSVLISLFLFTSTVFCYYSCNFLPDPAALGFAFIGWYFFFMYYFKGGNLKILLSFVFFTLSSLIKITYLINPITIVVMSLIELFLFRNSTRITKKEIIRYVVFGTICLLIVISWNAYVIFYNNINNSHSFNTQALPIWNIPAKEIYSVWDLMYNYWYGKYFAFSSFHLLFIIIPFQIIFIKKSNKIISLTTLVLFMGSLAYFILFYSQFRDHDYYFMVFFPMIIFMLINAISILKNILFKNYAHYIMQAIFFIILVSGINYARMKLNERYESSLDNLSRIGFLLTNISPELERIQISKSAKFVVVPDGCQNGGLYFLNRKGWNIEKKEDFSLNKIEEYQKKGAEYLLVSIDDKNILSMAREAGEQIYQHGGITIFKLVMHNVIQR